MEGFLNFLGVIVGIVLIVFIIKLIIWIFRHPLFGRVMGLIFAIGGFVIALYTHSYVAGSAESGENFAAAFLLAIVYNISYHCALGAGSDAFDTYWDGSYSLTISEDSIDLSKNISGGFIASFIGGLIVYFILSVLAVSSMSFLSWLIPIILAIANIVLIVKVIIG